MRRRVRRRRKGSSEYVELPPVDAECQIKGLFYKVGIHSLAFMWVAGLWIRSTKNIDDINRSRGSWEQ